eukprot:2493706-Prymnesium_polylepis.1
MTTRHHPTRRGFTRLPRALTNVTLLTLTTLLVHDGDATTTAPGLGCCMTHMTRPDADAPRSMHAPRSMYGCIPPHAGAHTNTTRSLGRHIHMTPETPVATLYTSGTAPCTCSDPPLLTQRPAKASEANESLATLHNHSHNTLHTTTMSPSAFSHAALRVPELKTSSQTLALLTQCTPHPTHAPRLHPPNASPPTAGRPRLPQPRHRGARRRPNRGPPPDDQRRPVLRRQVAPAGPPARVGSLGPQEHRRPLHRRPAGFLLHPHDSRHRELPPDQERPDHQSLRRGRRLHHRQAAGARRGEENRRRQERRPLQRHGRHAGHHRLGRGHQVDARPALHAPHDGDARRAPALRQRVRKLPFQVGLRVQAA